MMRWHPLLAAAVLAALSPGCSDSQHDHSHPHSASGGHGAADDGHAHGAEPAGAHAHEHKAPHGGTAVVLGKEEFHIEFLLDPAAGRLTAWILDSEMEKFIRINTPSFEVAVPGVAGGQLLVLKAVENTATGEKTGDSSQFEAQAEWLKSTPQFEAKLRNISIRGNSYQDVPFHFPKGNE